MTDPALAREDDLRLQLLVLRCQAGDERAFSQLLDDFGPRTLRYLRGLLGDDAEDVHQEVWLAAYRSIATLWGLPAAPHGDAASGPGAARGAGGDAGDAAGWSDLN